MAPEPGSLAMQAVDPALAFRDAASLAAPSPTGLEPVLAGALREQAVWVDEAVCIGCRYCAHVAANTFLVEERWGRSRAIRQDGDSTALIQEAIDTCPVDCIHWVAYEELPALADQLAQQDLQPLGFPSPARVKRTLPRRSAPTPSQ
ncbi:ferredoxin [Cyanobium sp. NIES-981]|uniref:ferredoxin n=1 Tax=Cyanobium sp. NIES-981 TaxID=1851505 RepID=UPI001CEDFA69|nr:ferredoxin [Cyanobium sp. NIES-981]